VIHLVYENHNWPFDLQERCREFGELEHFGWTAVKARHECQNVRAVGTRHKKQRKGVNVGNGAPSTLANCTEASGETLPTFSTPSRAYDRARFKLVVYLGPASR
jgi:hypothetical protein